MIGVTRRQYLSGAAAAVGGLLVVACGEVEIRYVQGPPGPPGPAGPQGEKGAAGPRGEKGAAGAAGKAVIVEKKVEVPVKVPAVPAKARGPVTVTFMWWVAPSPPPEYDQLAKVFAEKHGQKIKLDLEPIRWKGPADYNTKLTTMIAGGTPPDAPRVPFTLVPPMVRRGVFQDLGPFIRRDQKELDLDDIFPAALEANKYHGKQYGLPPNATPQALYYQEDALRRLGLEMPAQLFEQDKWTWQTVQEYALRLTTYEGNTLIRPGLIFGPRLDYPTTSVVWGFGGDFFSKDLKQCTLNTPEAVEGLRWIQDRVQRDRSTVGFGFGNYPEGKKSPHNDFIKFGNYGMATWWFGFSGWLKARKVTFPWNKVPLPAGPRTGSGPTSGNIIHAQTMIAQTKHPEATWTFVKFISGKEGLRILMGRGTQLTPPRQSLAEVYAQVAQPPSGEKFLSQAVQRSRPFPRIANQTKVFQVVNKGLGAIFNGKIAVRDGAEQIVREANELIRQASS